jgi:tetratricopeptide (TPR) repeat protein
VQVYTELAAVEGIMEDHETSLEYANRALSLAEELGIDPPPRAFGYRAASRICLGDDGGLADYHDAIARATAAGQGRDVAVMYNWLGVDSIRSRGPGEVLQVFHDAVAYTKAHGLTEMGNRLGTGSMDVLLSLGELAEVLELAAELVPQLEAADDRWSLQDLRSVQARALTLRGESEHCVAWLDWLETSGRESGDPPSIAIGIGAAALVWASLSDHQKALKLFGELAENPAVGTTVNAAVQLPFWTRALISLGHVELAERLATTPATTFPCLAYALMTSHAAIAEARGQHAEALAGYNDAVRRFRDFGSVTEEAFALLGEGRCLIALGQAHEAVGPLKQAHDIVHRMGARPTAAEIESLLAAASSS